MLYLELCVTQKVISQVKSANDSQSQITIKGPIEVLNKIKYASKKNFIRIHISNAFTLNIGDTHAIWFAHQISDTQKGDFIDIYSLLARRAETVVSFQCSFD